MVTVYYSSDYVLAQHSFDTTRKARWVADSLQAQPIPGIEIVAPQPATEDQVRWAHSGSYVDAVRTGAPRHLAVSQGFAWDPALWPMVLASNGGAIAAALAALHDGVAGSLSSGLHHAERDHGKGFCTFNGLAIAARAALAAGAQAVLILDLDAHCGGGTQSLVGDDPRIWHCDVAVDSFDRYIPGARALLSVVCEASTYLPTITRHLAVLEEQAPHFDLCLYNAGMDPHEGCTVGGLDGITTALVQEREELVFAWCQRRAISVAFVLAGGYVGPNLRQAELVALHRLTLTAAAHAQQRSPACCDKDRH